MIDPAIAVIQARLSSSRLPGKVMNLLVGKPMIWHIYKRAEMCKFVAKVIIATSNDPSDDHLAEFCYRNHMNVYRGSLTNVLDRFIQILKQDTYKYYVRITGDCPLIHPDFIDNQIVALNKYDADSIWIPDPGGLFEGQGVHSSQSLFHIAEESNHHLDLEHVGSEYLANNPHLFKFVKFEITSNLVIKDIRLVVDEMEDYLFFQKIYDALWKGQPIDLFEVISFLDRNPDIKSINQGVKHKKYNIQIKEKKRKNQPPNLIGSFVYDG